MTADFLTDIIPRDRIFFEEPMSRHTSFRVGGPAEILLMPRSEGELVHAVRDLRRRQMQFCVIGRGTNILVSDEGIRGVVILLSGGEIIDHGDGLIRAGAGVPLTQLYDETAFRGYTGLEFAAGIPGTLGGAVTMNAGAYGREFRDVVANVRMLDAEGHVVSVPNFWMQFGYRTSVVQRRELIVLTADLRLERGDVEQSRRKVAALREQRKQKQPLDLPSAGSTFRRPENGYAGALIESCGLKGASVGGAMVSPKHAGFIVNTGNATAQDIYRLMTEVKNAVRSSTGIELQPEVRLLGHFPEPD